MKKNKVDDSIDCSGYRYQDAINCPGIKWEYCNESGDESFDTGCDDESTEIQISQQAQGSTNRRGQTDQNWSEGSFFAGPGPVRDLKFFVDSVTRPI